MIKSIILGFDPGFTGAMAAYDAIAKVLVDVKDMPLSSPGPFDSNVLAPKTIDTAQVATWVARWAPHSALAILERVSAAPEQGVVSMFRFGEGYGILQGVIVTHGIRLLRTPPSVWKSQMGVSAEKQTSIKMAQDKFGSEFIKLKKHHGRAEAGLLALFGASMVTLKK